MARCELEPCPFCGGDAHVSLEAHGKKFYIGCSNDECLGFSGLGWLYDTEEDAAKAWNNRAERKTGDKNLKTDELYLASINLGIRLITQIKPENKWYLCQFLEAEIIDAIDYYKQKAGVSISDRVE